MTAAAPRALGDAAAAALGDELYEALVGRFTVAPLTARVPGLTVEDAYHVQRRMVQRRLDAGERVIGKKIGVTSLAVQRMLDVHTPDFGWLLDGMRFEDGAEVPVSRTMIQPRAEGELAFRLARDLVGPGVTGTDVVAATAAVLPCFEIVDSRIADWRIRYEDTVADNASCGVFVLGTGEADPREIDFPTCRIDVWKNGAPLSSGSGSEALGSPVLCVAWLANTLGRFGIPLRAGEIVLSGSLVPLEPVAAGDVMTLEAAGIGTATVRFT